MKYIFITIEICFAVCLGLRLDDPNACPRKSNDSKVVECCPDYFEDDGVCKECQAGKFGMNCKVSCLNGFYGKGCNETCKCDDKEICDPVDGCVCEAGLTGVKCGENCPVGTYGLKCNKTCLCTKDVKCHPQTGQCQCPPGRHGKHCLEECLPGFFGQNCSNLCTCPPDAHCNNVNGECKCNKGERCAINPKEECPVGTYGPNCNKTCWCANNARCDQETGNCICPPGWIGTYCTKVATSGRKKNVLSTEGIIIIALSLVGLIALSTFLAWNYFRGQLNQNSEPEAEEVHYDEISLYHDINPQESIDQRNVTNEIEPTYVRQDRRLSLPNSWAVNKEQETVFNGNSLPNLCNDDTYVNPYCTLLPLADEMQHFTVQFLTPRTRCRSAEYLNPYSVLNRK